jgi:hypothetical protein
MRPSAVGFCSSVAISGVRPTIIASTRPVLGLASVIFVAPLRIAQHGLLGHEVSRIGYGFRVRLVRRLDKAGQYAATKKFNVRVLMTSRLAPDMQPFIYQVQSACDYVKGGRRGSRDRRRLGTRTTSKRSTTCAHQKPTHHHRAEPVGCSSRKIGDLYTL